MRQVGRWVQPRREATEDGKSVEARTVTRANAETRNTCFHPFCATSLWVEISLVLSNRAMMGFLSPLISSSI